MDEKGDTTQEVLASIPHREPFLFVDKILHLTDIKITAERILRKEEKFFHGHYPQMPIMPGVLLCEALFQTAGILMSQRLLREEVIAGKIPVLVRIESAKFKYMAFPNDRLHLQADFIQKIKDFYFFKGMVEKEDKTLLTIKFVLGLIEQK